MKFTSFLLFCGLVNLIAGPSYSQNTKISLDMKDASIESVLNKIEEVSEFYFLFNQKLIDVERKVNVVSENEPIKNILHDIFTKDVRFIVSDRQIVLTPVQDAAALEALLQQQTVTGKVTDASTGEPMLGVNIQVKGTIIGTITGIDGSYSLTFPDKDAILVFSFIGMKTKEIAVDNKTQINVTLEKEAIGLEEVVAIAYGTQKKTSLTSAVSTLNAEKLTDIPAANVTMGLGGRIPGLIVRQTVGEPGRDANSFYIRGISTTGSTQPLLIVDGIPRGFQDLDPNSIESFTILKDAAAIAPYGVAGANGVVLVTTKRGQTGLPTVTYNGYVGFQNPTVLPELPTAAEYASMINAASVNGGGDPPYNDYDLQKFKDGTDPDGHPNHNVYDELFKKNAPLVNHNIEITGGAERIKYYGSLGYQDQAGIWSQFYQKRFNYSLNIDADVTKTTKISFGINGREQLNSSSSVSTSRLFELVHYAAPIDPLYLKGNLPGEYITADLEGAGAQRRHISQIYTQISVEQELPFIPGLKAKGTFAFDPTYNRTKAFRTVAYMWSVDTTQTPYVYNQGIFEQVKPSLNQRMDYSKQLTYQVSLNYNKTFGESNVGVLLLGEAKSNDALYFEAARRNYDLSIDELNMGSSNQADISNSGSSNSARQMGFVYRLNYDYAQKYLLEVTGRYDGSYYFAPEKRWGFFPAFSLGWRISEENFMKNFGWLDNLKIRGSYGVVGALAGAAFQYLSMYDVYGPAAVLGGGAVQAAREGIESNVNITWEKAKKTDIGLDATLWKGLLQLEADYFYELRSNMLANPTVIVPLEYGVTLSQVNAAKMDNRGFELSITTNYNVSKDLRISLGGNFTFAKNKLLEVFETASTYDNPNRRITGRPLGTEFGYEFIGYFQPEDFDKDGNLLSGIATQPWGKVYPGDCRYRDVNNDGEIDNDDIVPIGAADIPQIIYGMDALITYKRFSLGILFQGVGKTSIYGTGDYWDPFTNGRSAFKSNMDYWTPENQNASHCRITPSPTSNNSQTSSYHIFNSRYLRLKSLNISYNVPMVICRKAGLQNARIFVSGQNLLTFTPIINYDPEIINTYAFDYPQQRVISVGVNLTFY